jgi:hypothetical protein
VKKPIEGVFGKIVVLFYVWRINVGKLPLKLQRGQISL